MLQKKIIQYSLYCTLLFVISFAVHSFILGTFDVQHPFTLWKIYLFQSIATLVICTTFEVIYQTIPSLKDQLGFFYLAAMFAKIALFSLFFSDILFSSLVLSKTDSVSLLIPVFLFLFLEVMIIVKILNRNN